MTGRQQASNREARDNILQFTGTPNRRPRQDRNGDNDWFSFYHKRWRKDTEDMTDTQARVYVDFLCICYEREDGIVRRTDKQTANELGHTCSIQKWRAVKAYLLAHRFLVETPCGGLTNKRVLGVVHERQQRSNIRAKAAEIRHKNPKLPFKNNKGGDAHACTRARESTKETKETVKKVGERASAHPPAQEDLRVSFEGGRIELHGELRAYWLKEHDDDAKALELALMQAAPFIQPNGSKPLEVKVSAQLAKQLSWKRERDSRAPRAAHPTDQTSAERKMEAFRAAVDEAQNSPLLREMRRRLNNGGRPL